MPSGGTPALNLASFGVATLDVGFPASCLMAFRGSFVPNIASCGIVATNGVGFQTSCFKTSLGSSVLNMAFLVASRRSASVFHRRFQCHPEAHLRQMWRLLEAAR
jgi:hypothetical protein